MTKNYKPFICILLSCVLTLSQMFSNTVQIERNINMASYALDCLSLLTWKKNLM